MTEAVVDLTGVSEDDEAGEALCNEDDDEAVRLQARLTKGGGSNE